MIPSNFMFKISLNKVQKYFILLTVTQNAVKDKNRCVSKKRVQKMLPLTL